MCAKKTSENKLIEVGKLLFPEKEITEAKQYLIFGKDFITVELYCLCRNVEPTDTLTTWEGNERPSCCDVDWETVCSKDDAFIRVCFHEERHIETKRTSFFFL